MSKIQPRTNQVLIKPIEEDSIKKEHGIEIPPSAEKSVPDQGEIMAMGKEVGKDLKTGMKVIFNKFSSKDFRIKEQTYYLCSDEDILAIIQ
jgi:co-chaperonin GroES (HSP10)